jgi:O-antigen/teichoic acid export membrane protein
LGLLKKLAGEAVIYGMSSVVGRLLNYLLVPLYTTVFLPAEYGIVTELYAYVAFLNILYLYGMETAFFRFANKKDGRDYYSSTFLLILFSSLIFSGVLALFATSITNALQYPDQELYIYCFSAILAADAISALPFALLRLQGKAIKFASIKLANIGLNIGLNLLFLIWLPSHQSQFLGFNFGQEIGVGYVFLANLIANFTTLLFLFRELLLVKLKIIMSDLGDMLKYAWPLLLIGFAGVTNEMLSRAMLKYLLPEGFYEGRTNLEALGIFGACYKLSVFMTLGIQAFRYAAEPFFFSRAMDKESPALFAKVTDVFVIFGCWVLFAISINLDILGGLFLRNPIYLEGLVVVPYLLMGGLFLGIYYNLSIWYKLTDRTVFGAAIAIAGALVTIALNLLLVPNYGYEGSAWTTLLTYLSMVVMSYYWGQKYYPIPYKVGKGITYLIITAISIFLYQMLPDFDLYLKIGINVFLMVVSGFAIFMLEKK